MTEFHVFLIICFELTLFGLCVSIITAGGWNNFKFFVIKLPLQILGGLVAYTASFGRQSYTITWEQGEKEYKIKIGW